MNKNFLFRGTDTKVDCYKQKKSVLNQALQMALDRSVIVQTKTMFGGGTIVGDRVITSYVLVADVSRVFIRFRRGKKMVAFVGRKEAEANLAELLPTDTDLFSKGFDTVVKTPEPRIGKIGEIGSPLLVVDVLTGVPSINVAGMLYANSVSERFEHSWKIDPRTPKGIIGGAVWNIYGEFVGISIGKKIQPENFDELEIPSVYALPAEDAMNFAFSAN